MPTNQKGRGFFKKTEKERLSASLIKKKRKLKSATSRGKILEKAIKKTAESQKKAEEKTKSIEQRLSSLK